MGIFNKDNNKQADNKVIDIPVFTAETEKTAKRLFLVDYENVSDAGVVGVDTLAESDTVIIFYGSKVKSVAYESLIAITSSKASIEHLKAEKTAARCPQTGSLLWDGRHENRFQRRASNKQNTIKIRLRTQMLNRSPRHIQPADASSLGRQAAKGACQEPPCSWGLGGRHPHLPHPPQQATWPSPALQASLGLPPAPSWRLCQTGRVLCPILTC